MSMQTVSSAAGSTDERERKRDESNKTNPTESARLRSQCVGREENESADKGSFSTSDNLFQYRQLVSSVRFSH